MLPRSGFILGGVRRSLFLCSARTARHRFIRVRRGGEREITFWTRREKWRRPPMPLPPRGEVGIRTTMEVAGRENNNNNKTSTKKNIYTPLISFWFQKKKKEYTDGRCFFFFFSKSVLNNIYGSESSNADDGQRGIRFYALPAKLTVRRQCCVRKTK